MENQVTPNTLSPLSLKSTAKTPEVLLNPVTSSFYISGRSIPEDAIGFYNQINNWLDSFAANAQPTRNLQFVFELEYFNTSSSKCLLNVFKKIEDMFLAGIPASIIWKFDEDDEDMEETGEDYRDFLEVPFELKPIAY